MGEADERPEDYVPFASVEVAKKFASLLRIRGPQLSGLVNKNIRPIVDITPSPAPFSRHSGVVTLGNGYTSGAELYLVTEGHDFYVNSIMIAVRNLDNAHRTIFVGSTDNPSGIGTLFSIRVGPLASEFASISFPKPVRIDTSIDQSAVTNAGRSIRQWTSGATSVNSDAIITGHEIQRED